MRGTRKVLWIFAVIIFALAAVIGLAQPAAATSPSEQVQSTIVAALAVVENDALTEGTKFERLRSVFSQRLNFPELSKLALGRHWPPDRDLQEEFIRLFQKLLEEKYLTKTLLKEGKGTKVVVLRESKEDSTAVLVETKIVRSNGTEIPVDYRMHLVGDQWLAYDIRVEGVSLVGNYRTQFNSFLIRNGGEFPKLLAELKKRAK